MRQRVGLRKKAGAVTIMFLVGLSTGTAAWGQAAGPFDTFTVTPCRILDTRAAIGLPLSPGGTAGPGPVPANATLRILVTGDLTAGGMVDQGGATNCQVPDTAAGVFVNVVAVSALGPGHLTVYPSNTSLPVASTLNFSTGQTVANGVLVPICTPAASCPNDLNITMGPGGAHLVVDITGYLLPTPP